jgi:NAD(P)-dependent dehydrogenase (short-subunit alcohol dehydrogenase family)
MPVCVVTGAADGIGFNFIVKLARRKKYHLILATRTEQRGAETVERITSLADGPVSIQAFVCDLNSLASVRSFALNVLQTAPFIDALVLNAGVMGGSSFDAASLRSADGFESTFAINHIAHFLLLNLLIPALAPNAHIVVTTSEAHFSGAVPPKKWREIAAGDGALVWTAYARSKFANVVMAKEAQRRLGARVRVVAVHPGLIPATRMFFNQSQAVLLFYRFFLLPLLRLFGKVQTLDQGLEGGGGVELYFHGGHLGYHTFIRALFAYL